MANHRIDIEFILQLRNQLDWINQLSLKGIDFYENGKQIDIPEAVVDDFAFVGLSNVDFITTGFYNDGGGNG